MSNARARHRGTARLAPARWPALVLALALALSLPAAAAGGAEQPRPRIEADGYPWRALGRLNRQGGGFCTAALVAPDLVLTAAHCLYDARAGLWAPPERLHFVAGYEPEGFAFHARAESYRVDPNYTPGGRRRSGVEAAQDWAAVRLAAAAPAGLGYLGIARLDRRLALPSAADYDLAGYGRDRPYALSAELGCRLRGWDAKAGLLLHDCQAARGTSGAPVVMRRGEDYFIVALHVGRAEVGGETVGVAVPGDAFFESLRALAGRAPAHGADGLDILPGSRGE